ncbi:alpha/beta fold hydrolase [Rhodococcus erythropolis]|uniref:alpha/beta fold hydrolase n=1 Tax=Rhodococcus erythropolis TaxID=1833 RepID=UPI0004925040|nr:alpha/beta fold hydrolase [Rhodococcus erythropolis]
MTDTWKLTTASGMTFDMRAWGPQDGRTVLALHGFPQGAVSWEGLGQLLARSGIRLLTFDQRGYSPGARPPLETYTVPNYVDDVLAIADASHLEYFDVIGFGMGGLQSWAVAAVAPERVRSVTALVFPHPAAFAHAIETVPAQTEAWNRLEKMSPAEPAARALLADNGNGLRTFLLDSGMPDPVVEDTVTRVGTEEVLVPAIAWHLVPLDDMAAIGRVNVPSLYLWSHSPALVRSTSESCGQWVDGPYRSIELSGVGHWILESSPESVVEPLLAHLASAPAEGVVS